MSDVTVSPAPALGLIELDSIAAGITAGDAMVKSAPLTAIFTGTVHPGKYLILVTGDTASVEVAMDAGAAVGGPSVLDSILLPDADPSVPAAMTTSAAGAEFGGEALGILESATVATVVEASDAAVKAAQVDLIALRMADGLGGKGYSLVSGPVSDVEAAVASALDRAALLESQLTTRIIPQLHADIGANLGSDLLFMNRISTPVRGDDS